MSSNAALYTSGTTNPDRTMRKAVSTFISDCFCSSPVLVSRSGYVASIRKSMRQLLYDGHNALATKCQWRKRLQCLWPLLQTARRKYRSIRTAWKWKNFPLLRSIDRWRWKKTEFKRANANRKKTNRQRISTSLYWAKRIDSDERHPVYPKRLPALLNIIQDQISIFHLRLQQLRNHFH